MYKEEPRHSHKRNPVELNLVEWGLYEAQESQRGTYTQIVNEIVQLINNIDIENAARILEENSNIANKIFHDERIQQALSYFYKPTEKFCILIGKDEYSVETLATKVLMDFILRGEFTQYLYEEIDILEECERSCTWRTKDNGDLYLNIDDKSILNCYRVIKFNEVLRGFLDSETCEGQFIKLKEEWRKIFDLVKNRNDVATFMNNLRKLYNTNEGEERIIKLKDLFRDLFRLTDYYENTRKLFSRNEDKDLIKFKQEFGEIFDSEESNDSIIKLDILLKKYFDSEDEQLTINEFLKFSERFVILVNKVKKGIDNIVMNLPESDNEHYPNKKNESSTSEIGTIKNLCFIFLRMKSSANDSVLQGDSDFCTAKEFSQKFLNENEIRDAIKEAWPELAGLLEENISGVDLRAVIVRAVVINLNCESNISLDKFSKENLMEIFSLCKENCQKFDLSYEDLLNDKCLNIFRPYYEGQREEFNKLINLVLGCTGKVIAICTHVHPDHDAYGSQIALALLLEKFGAKVFLYNPSANKEISHNQVLKSFGLQDLAGNDLVIINSTVPEKQHFDQVILLDCPEERVGVALPKDTSEYLRFDHHEGANFVQALATCEFIGYLYEILKLDEKFMRENHSESNILLDKNINIESLIPLILYAGCYMDSSRFKRQSKNLTRLKERFEGEYGFLSKDVASSLVDYGCPNLYRNRFYLYLSNNHRAIKLKNGLGLIVFDEIDSSRFPEISFGVITNSYFDLPYNFARIFPPTKDKKVYDISFRNTKFKRNDKIINALMERNARMEEKAKYAHIEVTPTSFIPSIEVDYKAIDAADAFGGGGHQGAAGCSIKPEDILDPEYARDIVKRITGWSNEKYEESELARNLEKLRSEDDNDVRLALRAIALSRGDYVEALKLSCPSFSLLDVGGIYINKYVTSLALILESISDVYNVEDSVDDIDDYDDD